VTRLQRSLRRAFWIGTPLAIAAVLMRPRQVVLYMGGDAPSFGRPASRLPALVADVMFLYAASILAMAILLVAVAVLRRRGRCGVPVALSLSACFLPTYVAGIEATDHIRWAMRCHSMSLNFDVVGYLSGEAAKCAAAIGLTMVVGVVSALSLGHRSRVWIPIPSTVGAVMASVAALWLTLLFLVWPLK
jgi:hypothetical protein